MRLNQYDLALCVRRLPKKVADLIKINPCCAVVAGGFIRAVVAHEEVSDVDIFCPSRTMASAWTKYLIRNGYRTAIESENAFTVLGQGLPVQFVHRWTYDDPMKVVESFDFSICAASLWWNGDAWQSNASSMFYEDLAAKRLNYLSPVRKEAVGGSLLRVLKFYRKGYNIDMPSLSKVLSRVFNQVDMSKIDERKDGRVESVVLELLREVDPLIDCPICCEEAI